MSQLIVYKKKQTKGGLRVATATIAALPTVKKSSRNRGRGQTSMSQEMLSYAKTVIDPWENSPVQLGYLSLVPTVCATAYLRMSSTVNGTDGSFSFLMLPQLYAMVYRNVGSQNTVSWSAFGATNEAAVRNQIASGRVVSMGLRCFALFPETSAPGVLFAGSLPGDSPNTVITYTTNNLAGTPSAELGLGSKGARVVGLPIDLQSLEFQSNTVSPVGFGSTPSTTTPIFVSGLGFPIGTTIWIEAVLNIEGFPTQTLASSGIDVDSAPPTLMDRMPNFESVVAKVRGLVGNAAVMDGVAGLANLAGYPGISRALSSFGHGQHYRRNLLAAGRNVANQGKQNSMVIEEMAEDAGARSSSSVRASSDRIQDQLSPDSDLRGH